MHDSDAWEHLLEFKLGRFLVAKGDANVDIRGGDLHLAFGITEEVISREEPRRI